jgi:hypothetical protein
MIDDQQNKELEAYVSKEEPKVVLHSFEKEKIPKPNGWII